MKVYNAGFQLHMLTVLSPQTAPGKEAIDAKHCDKEVCEGPVAPSLHHLDLSPSPRPFCITSTCHIPGDPLPVFEHARPTQGMTAFDHAVQRKHRAVQRMLAPPRPCVIL